MISKSRELDQFYTTNEVASLCVGILCDTLPAISTDTSTLFIEPSAGKGAFLNAIQSNHKIGFDIDPKLNSIIRQDFLKLDLSEYKGDGKLVFIGNPPFGKNASLAVKFFNHCATYADVIAFIVPKSFNKPSIRKRLNGYFEIIYNQDTPHLSFTLNNEPMDVPCTFQIWIKTDSQIVKDTIPQVSTCADFTFSKRTSADFAIRRIGAHAGKVIEDFTNYSDNSHYFIDVVDKQQVNSLIHRFRSIVWTHEKQDNAGVPSISKPELITKFMLTQLPHAQRSDPLACK